MKPVGLTGEKDAQWMELMEEQGNMSAFLRNAYLECPEPVPTGIGALDAALTGGLRPGLSVLGGEPGAGKSALGLQTALRQALDGRRAVFASLEMSREQCLMRAISCLTSSDAVRGDGFEQVEWASAWKGGGRANGMLAKARREGRSEAVMNEMRNGGDPVITGCALMAERCPGFLVAAGPDVRTLEGISDLAGRAAGCGARLLVVDYLQLVQPQPGQGALSEYERVTAVSAGLNAIGNDLGLAVLALSSMSRQSAREGLDMHGFKGSGGIEYDANAAMVLRRAECEAGDARPVELHVMKNRWGPLTGRRPVRLLFDGAHNAMRAVAR